MLIKLLLIGMAGCGEDDSISSGSEFKVERVIDGDTVVLVGGRTVRYIGIDTPERGEPYYEEAREANRHLVEGEVVRLELDEEEKDRYGRTLAYVYADDIFVNMELVKQGYARAYPYPPNVKYENTFSNAEDKARQKRIGIWSSRPKRPGIEIAEVTFDPPGDDRDNLNGEWVVIANNADASIDMTGFTLSDDSDHVYSFGDFVLSAGGTVKVFTGSGADTLTSLYWGSKSPIWNNDGDTAYLRNSDGSLLDEYSY